MPRRRVIMNVELKTTVNGASSHGPILQRHLKNEFQWKFRTCGILYDSIFTLSRVSAAKADFVSELALRLITVGFLAREERGETHIERGLTITHEV